MRSQALIVFERGVIALSQQEVQDMSSEWLTRVTKGNYLAGLRDRQSQIFRDNKACLNTVDHIELVL